MDKFFEGNCYISYLQPEDKNDKPETQTPMRTTRVLVVREFRTIVVIEIPQLNNNDKKNDSNKETMQAELETPETLFPEGQK